MVQSAVVRVVDESIKPLGFQRRGHSWYRITSDLYSVINVQKSRWSESCYINIGFSPSGQVENLWLPESRCQVRFRLDSLKRITREGLLLLEGGTDQEVKLRASLVEKIGNPLAQFVVGVTNLDDLRGALNSDVTGNVFIHGEIRPLLASPD
ncbi:DUF4304 domain-containing protein [Streptomyces alkaliphilus]|uniref:DUF4304 domain-containing protein n=1 Tax=Streptomyces alkaliphilus TaxID=1472722 RepID=UPI00117BF310|nr:DUF4304 domain-containing protein [Streptomyces alkaliphilus]